MKRTSNDYPARNARRERIRGQANGRLHNWLDPLCTDNLRKIRLATVETPASISSYWTGYLIGLTSNPETELILELQRDKRINDLQRFM